MAWTCILWRSLCVLLVVFALNLDVLASQDYYKYHTDDIEFPQDIHELKLLDEELHHIKRRSASDTPPNADSSTSPITDNRTNQQSSNKTTKNEKKKVPSSKNKTAPDFIVVIRKNGTTTTTPLPKVTAAPNSTQLTTSNNSTDNSSEFDYEEGLTLDDFEEDEEGTHFNETLKSHNITEMKTDAHIYYNSSLITDADLANHYWVDMKTNKSDFKINAMLSKSYRRAATIKLSFDFPIYGHLIRNVTVATGGFIYTGEYAHSWLAATQYIAPLMANFDIRLSNESFIKYVDNGTSFTVQWENVVLQDKPEDGEFTFQTTLFDNGDIVFVYRKIPVVIENITDDHHPVKVGLSDAYVIDRTIFFVRRKTIYEYHRVDFKRDDIKNDTVIYLQAQSTCLNLTDCQSCLSSTINNFNCTWCPSTNRCSTGLDRHRQDWLMKGCDRKQLNNESQCNQADKIDFAIHDNGNNGYNFDPNKYDHDHDYDQPKHDPSQWNHSHDESSNNKGGTNKNNNNSRPKHIDSNVVSDSNHDSNVFHDGVQASRISPDRDGSTSSNMGASGIITILFLVASVAAAGVWVLYAYRNPHTTSGQMLIRYRPSQWRWRRGEARYTAATIHM